MREIKFRCWDGIGNHGMQYFDSLQEIADHYRGHKYQAEMQYTGLKDKDGKEIYEGDIVDLINRSSCDGCNGCTREDLITYCFVKWDEQLLSFTLEEITLDKQWITYEQLHKNTEVSLRGNIYENQELLKEDL